MNLKDYKRQRKKKDILIGIIFYYLNLQRGLVLKEMEIRIKIMILFIILALILITMVIVESINSPTPTCEESKYTCLNSHIIPHTTAACLRYEVCKDD